MKKSDIDRLKTRFPSSAEGPSDRRLTDFFDFRIAEVYALGEAIFEYLDRKNHGIGWWVGYPLPTHTRILISDHLLACARGIPDNLIEAKVCLLELDHAVDDFRNYVQRGVSPRGVTMPIPRGPYEALTSFRVGAHFVGALRAFGSALDCLGACIVGVAALPTDLVRSDLKSARSSLVRLRSSSTIHAGLSEQMDLAESISGPPGWLDWLLELRNTEVHRARRLFAWEPDVRSSGTVSAVVGLRRQLPVDPELTEVEAWVRADSYVDAYFDAPLPQALEHIARSVHEYTNTVCDHLLNVWQMRAADPDLLQQPATQWRRGKDAPKKDPFSGYPTARHTKGRIVSIGASDEVSYRLEAAGITMPGPNGPRPNQTIWRHRG